jgi:hypothetical protein
MRRDSLREGDIAMRLAWIFGLGEWGAIGLAGCAARNTATESPSLDGSAWVLASLPGRSLVPDATPTARFEAGRVAGSDGCNRYSMPPCSADRYSEPDNK